MPEAGDHLNRLSDLPHAVLLPLTHYEEDYSCNDGIMSRK